ncbi:hypothetical protein [Methanolobus sp. WCC5]|uniref:hypothetical protein n=1 Tax=Methanolobus sp. WCC5 TaxID=3125785 RepID=UPI003248DB96
MVTKYSLKDRKVELTPSTVKKITSMEYSLSQRGFKDSMPSEETVNTKVTGYSLKGRQWITEEMICKGFSPSVC